MWDNVGEGMKKIDNSYSAIGYVYLFITNIVLIGCSYEVYEIFRIPNHNSVSHIFKAILEVCHLIAYFFVAMLYFDYAGDHQVAKNKEQTRGLFVISN